MVFNAGHDFPHSFIAILQAWSIQLDVRPQPNKPSARGLVFYSAASSNRMTKGDVVGEIELTLL